MSLMLATLCLNEMEWLPRLYEQHKDWPGLISWVFVESADRAYAKVNPSLVTPDGLSVDGTSEFLMSLEKEDSRVTYIPYGISMHENPAQGKVPSRNQYLAEADRVKPRRVFVLDADEFYDDLAQAGISRVMQEDHKHLGYVFRQHHVWRPLSIEHRPLFSLEVVGGYWDVPHARGWRWVKGMRYVDNHNTPETSADKRYRPLMRYDNMPDTPQCAHLGFASNLNRRRAKHQYYIVRGEGSKDGRQKYVDCRAAFETWIPGNKLPHGARVIGYTGPIPEVFK